MSSLVLALDVGRDQLGVSDSKGISLRALPKNGFSERDCVNYTKQVAMAVYGGYGSVFAQSVDNSSRRQARQRSRRFAGFRLLRIAGLYGSEG